MAFAICHISHNMVNFQGLEVLGAERIGHGYHVVDDESIYSDAKRRGVHFEFCLMSSFLTASADPDWRKHPSIRWKSSSFALSLGKKQQFTVTSHEKREGNYKRITLLILWIPATGFSFCFRSTAPLNIRLQALNQFCKIPLEQACFFRTNTVAYLSFFGYVFTRAVW